MTPFAFFTLLFLGTILVTRVALWLHPTPSPTVRGFRLHHWMYGAAGVVLAFVPPTSLGLYAVGLGLLVDEAPYVLTGGTTHSDNYSYASLFGVAGIATFIVILAEAIAP